MTKKNEIQNTDIPSVTVEEALDFIDELFTSGKVVDAVYGFNSDGDEFCIDLETGDIEITHEDGSFENIPGTDPRAQAFLSQLENGNE